MKCLNNQNNKWASSDEQNIELESWTSHLFDWNSHQYLCLFSAPYVKVYLLDGKTCIEKQRTRSSRRTLDPLIQQTLIFKENYRDKVLQIGVWGDYGKLDRKVFMGVCQINLEELRLSTGAQILDWFKLFSANSLMNNYVIVQQSPKRTISVTTNDSFSSFKSNSRLN